MRFACALSEHIETGQAVVQALEQLHAGLAGSTPDFVLVFATPHHGERFDAIARSLGDAFPGSAVAGAGAHGALAAGSEVEAQPAIALFAGALPATRAAVWHFSGEQLAHEPAHVAGQLASNDAAATLLLADPFSPGLEGLLVELDRAAPGVPTLGGVASGADAPGASALFAGDARHRDGVVAVTLSGALDVESVVAQGCRPIGTPMFVTSARGNTIHGLDGRSPMEALQELFEAADARERALLQSSLFLGVQMQGGRSEYEQGDFLVRNLIGADEESGALSVAAAVETNQVVQFHLRDAHTADEDLEHALRERTKLRERARGALLFSCVGRGQGLYGTSNHDSEAVLGHFGAIPLAGFFGNGEVGPVQGRTFLHAYTSALALFCEPAN